MVESTKKQFSGYSQMVWLTIANFGAFFFLGVMSGALPSTLERIGVDAQAISYANAIYPIIMFAASFLGAKVYEKLGSIFPVVFYFATTAAYVAAYIYGNSIILIYALAIFYGIGNGIGAKAGISQFVSIWFIDRRDEMIGYVAGVYVFGAAAGLFIYGGVSTALGSKVAGSLLFIVAFIISGFSCLMLRTPKQKGQKPLAYGSSQTTTEVGPEAALNGIDGNAALKTVSFWLLLISIMIMGCTQAPTTYLTLLLTGAGLPENLSSVFMGIMMAGQTIFMMLIGKILPKIKYVGYILITYFSLFIGYIILITGMDKMAMGLMVICTILMGCGTGISSLLGVFLVPHYYGMKAYKLTMPILTAALIFGSAIQAFTIVPIATADGGDWYRATIICGIGMAVSLALILVSYATAPKLKAEKN